MIDRSLALRIRLVGLDVDGVLTDGGIYVGQVDARPVELKKFNIQDGLGVRMLQRAGIPVVWISGRHSDATTSRARDIGVDELVQDDRALKLEAFEPILRRRSLAWEDCAFVGDDLADLPLLRRVGLPIAVANAVPEVKAMARYVTSAAGGQGAVREVAEVILRARGVWETVLTDYLTERGDAAAQAGRPD